MPKKEEQSSAFSHSAVEKWINEQRNEIKIHRKRSDCIGKDKTEGGSMRLDKQDK